MPSSRTAWVTVQEKVTMSSTMLRPVPSPVALTMEQEQVAMSGVPLPMNSLFDLRDNNYVLIIGNSATTTNAKLEVHGGISADYFTATSTTATSALQHLSLTALSLNNKYITDLVGSGLMVVSGALTLNMTGDWIGTFDSYEGSYYLANSFSTTSADYWDTTKTPRTADNLADNRLLDLQDVATTTTGRVLLYWNGTSWTDIATSSLGISTTDLSRRSKPLLH